MSSRALGGLCLYGVIMTASTAVLAYLLTTSCGIDSNIEGKPYMANICDVQRRFSLFLPSEPSELLGTLRYTSEHADNDMTLCSGLRNSIIKNPIFWTSQICGRIFSDVLRRPGTLTIYHIWVVFSSCLEIFYLPLIHFFASNHKELKNVAEIPFFRQ